MELPAEIQEMALQVPEKKQKEVQKVINDIFTGTEEWEKQVEAIEVNNIEDIMSIQLADTARKNVKTARLSAEKIFDAKREELKIKMSDFKLEDSLWLKSKQIMQLKFKHIEEKAKYKADFVERYKKEQHELTVEKRITQMFPLNPEITRAEIEFLTDETFDILLNGLIKAQEEKIAEEKKIESDRITAEKAEKERIAKIEAENKRLEKEAKEKERLAKIEREKIEKEREIERKKQAAILEKQQKEAKEKARIEAEKQAKINKEMEAKLAKEKAERQKVADELEAKRVKETKEKQEKEAELQALLNMGDTDKVKEMIKDLEKIKFSYSFKSAKNIKLYKEVNILIDKVINHINK